MSNVSLVISDSTYDHLVEEMCNKAIEMEWLELVFDVDELPKPVEEYTYREVEQRIKSLPCEQLISLAADLMH